MRKFLSLCCAVAIFSYALVHPLFTYYAMAEADTASVSEGDVSGGDDSDLMNLTEEDLLWIAEAREALSELLAEHTVMALVYLSDTYPVRAEASYDSEVLAEVPSGQQVLIEDVEVDNYYGIWEKVTLFYQGTEYCGYIPREKLACSDEKFLEWEGEYGMNPALYSVMLLGAEVQSIYPDVAQFPESYQQALTALKQAHPNWTFVKMNTNLEWSDVVYNELQGGRSLIPSSFPIYMQNGIYGTNWAYATQGSLEYYLDPRNWLNEDYIFQFEQLTYNASYHTEAAVQSFLNNTFMSGIVPGTELTYARTFWAVGAELGVSPFHLACRVYQEQGQGTSPLISGTYPGYEGYYNYFNIGATGTTNQAVIESGLARAKQENWYNGYYSILGGARVISSNYILRGQDTLYLQKFDVDASDGSLYWHQYMQNICAPSSEGKNIRRLYEGANSLENTFVFKIPVYNNMPAAACPKPTANYSVAVTPPEGYSDGIIYLDGIGYSTVLRDGQYVATASDGNAETAVMYKYNESGVPVGMYVWALSHDGCSYTVTPIPELQDLLTYHGFSIRIVGRSGIRFKTGISADLRSQLLNGGVAGYTLKEYGTLVMNKANMAAYPMIKGGEKVLAGLSYGYNSSGVLEDKIYETVNGRYRYTSVLVGMPAEQYKVEYAFRGYIILNKDGQDITIYGPAVAKSIYSLAQQVLAGGQYEPGSSADAFLRQLITDADSVSAQ